MERAGRGGSAGAEEELGLPEEQDTADAEGVGNQRDCGGNFAGERRR
jgi:hypothetical protein